MISEMEAHGIPEGIIDLVHNKVHQIGWKEITTSIHSIYSPFEKMFLSGYDSSMDELYEPDVSKNYLFTRYMGVEFIKFSATHFVLFYHYNTEGINEQIIIEGSVRENCMEFKRFYQVDTWKHFPKLINCVDDYFNEINVNWVPFKIIHQMMVRDSIFNQEDYQIRMVSKNILPKKIQKSIFNCMFDWYLANNSDY